MQLVVVTSDQTAPPTEATAGGRYIVASPGSGAWTDRSGEIAIYVDDVWTFVTPQPGWSAHVLASKTTLIFGAAAGWEPATGGVLECTPQLGINATSDAFNRLSVSSPATLLNHEGARHQLKLNKAEVGDTASLLFQTDFSGRAEMGLAGGDNFSVKVSADGALWKESLSIDANSGMVDFPQGARISSHDVIHLGSILGAVTETTGQPTGAIIERGSNVNGDYVRFADGTQICTAKDVDVDVNLSAGAIFRSAHKTIPFPMPFLAGSTVAGSGSSVNTINI